MNYKKMFIGTVSIVLAGLMLLSALTVIIDPCFHYHRPIRGIGYNLLDSMERYNNDGIIRNFDYDGIITGTSMTANFKASEFNELFGANVIKVPYSGGSFCEINNAVQTAVDNNENLKYVVRCLDYGRLIEKYDALSYDVYPDYLYDDNLFNDVYYWFNKEILVKCTMASLLKTVKGDRTIDSFDEYANWTDSNTFGSESVLKKYNDRPETISEMAPMTEEDYQTVHDNIYYNAVKIAKENPDITFYYFFSPYSILYYEKLFRGGKLEQTLLAEKYSIELMLECENIKLFTYNDMFDMVEDLDNYMDTAHYSEEINSMILHSMKEGTHLLTKENYVEYWNTCYNHYMNFDYSTYYESLQK